MFPDVLDAGPDTLRRVGCERSVVVDEFGADRLPIVTDVDIGHSDPQWIVPLGVMAELDPDEGAIRLLESAVT